MSPVVPSASRHLLLVDQEPHAGTVLERALTTHGWTVARVESASGLTAHGLGSFDALLLALDGDDADIFELLLSLSSLSQRPAVIVFTRRASARVLGPQVLANLGIDRVMPWPTRPEQIDAALHAVLRARQPERLVS